MAHDFTRSSSWESWNLKPNLVVQNGHPNRVGNEGSDKLAIHEVSENRSYTSLGAL